MKFQIREGYVARVITKVDLGDGQVQPQENNYYGGQKVDFDAETANEHVHKLEPLDKAAEAFLAAKVLPATQAATAGVTPETLELVKAMAAEMAKALLAAQQPAAAATPAA